LLSHAQPKNQFIMCVRLDDSGMLRKIHFGLIGVLGAIVPVQGGCLLVGYFADASPADWNCSIFFFVPVLAPES